MFVHPTEDYDFIIHLNPVMLPRYHQNISANLALLSSQGHPGTSVRPGFDPSRLLFADLQVSSDFTTVLLYSIILTLGIANILGHVQDFLRPIRW
jgi:hypothetical protein